MKEIKDLGVYYIRGYEKRHEKKSEKKLRKSLFSAKK